VRIRRGSRRVYDRDLAAKFGALGASLDSLRDELQALRSNLEPANHELARHTDGRLDALGARLAEVSHEVRHAVDLRFDSVEHRIAAIDERLERIEGGLELARESLVEATVYMTRALRERLPTDAE